LAPSRDDVLLGGEKILGGAIRRSEGALLYQGSLRIPQCLKDPEDDFSNRFAMMLAGRFAPRQISAKEREQAERLATLKYATAGWNAMR